LFSKRESSEKQMDDDEIAKTILRMVNRTARTAQSASSQSESLRIVESCTPAIAAWLRVVSQSVDALL